MRQGENVFFGVLDGAGFALVKFGSAIAAAADHGPAGRVWSDCHGRASMARLRPRHGLRWYADLAETVAFLHCGITVPLFGLTGSNRQRQLFLEALSHERIRDGQGFFAGQGRQASEDSRKIFNCPNHHQASFLVDYSASVYEGELQER